MLWHTFLLNLCNGTLNLHSLTILLKLYSFPNLFYMVYLCASPVDTTALEPYRGPHPTSTLIFKNVNCTGAETKLTHCQTTNHLETQSFICDHEHSVGVSCAAEAGNTSMVMSHNYA